MSGSRIHCPTRMKGKFRFSYFNGMAFNFNGIVGWIVDTLYGGNSFFFAEFFRKNSKSLRFIIPYLFVAIDLHILHE